MKDTLIIYQFTTPDLTAEEDGTEPRSNFDTSIVREVENLQKYLDDDRQPA